MRGHAQTDRLWRGVRDVMVNFMAILKFENRISSKGYGWNCMHEWCTIDSDASYHAV